MRKEPGRPSSRSTKRMAVPSNCQLQCFREPSDMSLNPQRTIAELKELRALTADDNGAQRIAWTDTWLKAREWLTSKLAGLPVEDHYDAAENPWISLPGASEKALILGSHLDSVPNGGWLDGCLGAMAGLEVLRG